MPCMSYETEWARSVSRPNVGEITRLKDEADKLARIACRAMAALEEIDPTLSMIKNAEARAWYAKHKKADTDRKAKEAAEKAKIEAAEKLRNEALAKLTPEEIAAFGLTKKGKK